MMVVVVLVVVGVVVLELELWGKAVLSVLGAVVVGGMGKLFTFVKM